MNDRYHVDLAKYALSRFSNNLETMGVIPSRMSLKVGLDEKFNVLEAAGITNLKELIDTLNSKQRIEEFSKSSGLSVEYLTLLKREASSYLPNPIRLDRIPGITPETLRALAKEGITNSRHIINHAGDKESRGRLSNITRIPMESLDELVCLSDLSRAYGVGPVFAKIIYDVGIKSIEDFKRISAEEFIRIYEEVNQKKADFGVGEIQFSLNLAQDLEIIVEV